MMGDHDGPLFVAASSAHWASHHSPAGRAAGWLGTVLLGRLGFFILFFFRLPYTSIQLPYIPYHLGSCWAFTRMAWMLAVVLARPDSRLVVSSRRRVFMMEGKKLLVESL